MSTKKSKRGQLYSASLYPLEHRIKRSKNRKRNKQQRQSRKANRKG